MNEVNRKQQVLQVLAKSVRSVVEAEGLDFEKVQEIRMRIEKPLILIYDNEERRPPSGEPQGYLITKEEIRETLEYISHYSLYAYEHEMRQGFITIEGGHRVGVMGKAILEGDKVKNLQYISSVNIRMSHEILGCADKVMPYITKNRQVCHTLVISPPCCGKTTLIRDLIRQISDGNMYVKGCTVGVVDERSEIGGCYLGVAQNELGMRTDVLDCCPKAEGMIMLIRSMAPQVIAVDEIGSPEDVHAIEYAMQCGCKMIASVHGLSMDEAADKPVLGKLIRERRFERYIILGNEKRPGEVREVYNERGACYAEIYRMPVNLGGNDGGGDRLWNRAPAVSGKASLYQAYCLYAERRAGIFQCTTGRDIRKSSSEGKRALPEMAAGDGTTGGRTRGG